MTTCSKCQKDNRDSAVYCRHCGNKIADITERLFTDIVGRKDILDNLLIMVDNAKYMKREGLNRPNLDILILGATGSGKSFFAEKIQDLFFSRGLISKAAFTKVDATDFDRFWDNLDDNARNNLNGGILFVDKVELLMTNFSGISPIDALFSKMEEWERSNGGWDDTPIVVMTGERVAVENYFIKKTTGQIRFESNIICLQNFSAQELKQLCVLTLAKDKITLSEEADKKLLGYFEYMVRHPESNFSNAYQATMKAAEISQKIIRKRSNVVMPEDIAGDIYIHRSPEEIVAELHQLVGMQNIKDEVDGWIKAIEDFRNKSKDDKALPPFFNHYVLTGNPGTGKTTVARLFAEILSELGYLSTGQLIETNASKLVGDVIGATEKQTLRAIDDAMGGVLFIDEAYTLANGGDGDFGRKALETLLPEVENRRGKFVCILAGYANDMQNLYRVNDGIVSRFNKQIHIDDYTPEELTAIFHLQLSRKNRERARVFGNNVMPLQLSEEAETVLPGIMKRIYDVRSRTFANAREVRNMFDKTLENLSKRTADKEAVSHIITPDDIPMGKPEAIDADTAMEELNKLVGLTNIKAEVQRLIAKFKIADLEAKEGELPKREVPHYIFMGNPGTGKTTVARLMAKIFRAMGALERGHLISVTEKDLVGKYVGHSEDATSQAVNNAMGGVLFIDEAYTLMKGDFGQKVMQTLLPRLSEDAGKFVCILAGYTKEMTEFIQSNSGFDRRFTTIEFEDYDPEALETIFRNIAKKKEFVLDSQADACLSVFFQKMYRQRDKENFGNAGAVVSLFEQVTARRGQRLIQHPEQRTEKKIITLSDIEGEKDRHITAKEASFTFDSMIGQYKAKEKAKLILRQLDVSQNRARKTEQPFFNNKCRLLLLGSKNCGQKEFAQMLQDVYKDMGLLESNRRHIMRAEELMPRAFSQTIPIDDAWLKAKDGMLMIADIDVWLQMAQADIVVKMLCEKLEADARKTLVFISATVDAWTELSRRYSDLETMIDDVVDFEKFSSEELSQLFRQYVKEKRMFLTEQADVALDSYFAYNNSRNSAEVELLFNKACDRQSARLSLSETDNDVDYTLLSLEDIIGEKQL